MSDYSEVGLDEYDVRGVLVARARIYREQAKVVMIMVRLVAIMSAPTDGTPLSELGLDICIEAMLEDLGIESIEALQIWDAGLLRTKGRIGENRLNQICCRLRAWLAGERISDPPLPDPTHWRPGSLEKLAILFERAERGEQLFHPSDSDGRVALDVDKPTGRRRDGVNGWETRRRKARAS